MKMYSSVIQSACISRKVCTTCLDNHRIHFYQINVPDPVVSGQFANNTAISGSNYHNIFCFFMNRHRHMRDHLIINKFVTFCQHYISVQSQNTAKFRCLKNINSLIITLSGKELTVYPDTVFHIRCMEFRKPHFHYYYLPVRTFSFKISGSSGPVILHPFAFAYSI